VPNEKPPTVAAAIAFAATKHVNQTDRAGQPYILHPLRVMAAMDTDEAKRVAILHDVVEDCGVTLDDLRALGKGSSSTETRSSSL
jgi:(p)ppGpp synthase/HD superfamily hydrolase